MQLRTDAAGHPIDHPAPAFFIAPRWAPGKPYIACVLATLHEGPLAWPAIYVGSFHPQRAGNFKLAILGYN